jgi:hypothetical protein
MIKRLIGHQKEKYGWEFVFFGARWMQYREPPK